MLSRYSHLWVYAIRYAIYFLIAWGAVYWRRWQQRRRETIAQTWPSTEAVILSGKVSPIAKTTRFQATLEYSYFAEEYQSGKYIHEFTSESDADDFVRQLKDKRVQVRYNPSRPEKSVLEQSVIAQHFILAPRFS
jgi:hypothetical protein